MLTKAMNLDDQIIHHMPIQAGANLPDVFGIEVELEGQNIKDPPPGVTDYWTQHNDASLRVLKPGDQATEYVFRQPFDMKTTHVAITRLFDYLTSKGVHVEESYRTSIHVHLNFAQETFRTIYNFMTLCLIFDELLVSQNGEHRIGNNFCLRSRDAMGQLIGLITSIEAGRNFFNIQHNERYNSINFASLTKFGSIEFRSLECTTHEGRLIHWIGTLSRMKEAARGYKNPVEIIQQFSMLGCREFLQTVLGPYAMKYANVSGHDEMLQNGMRIAQDLAYCSAWKEISPSSTVSKRTR